MMIGLLWIIGSYAASILVVHWLHRRNRLEERKPMRIWLITNNNQMQVEWFVRYLHLISWIKGRDIEMIVADEGSTDDTVAIAERLSLHYQLEIRNILGLEMLEDEIKGEGENHQVLVIRVSN